MVHQLAEGKDSKGIRCLMTCNENTQQISICVWRGDHSRTEVQPLNRFGFKRIAFAEAEKRACEMAGELERELGL